MSEVFAAAEAQSEPLTLKAIEEKLELLAGLMGMLISKIPPHGSPTLQEELELRTLERDELREKLAALIPRVGS